MKIDFLDIDLDIESDLTWQEVAKKDQKVEGFIYAEYFNKNKDAYPYIGIELEIAKWQNALCLDFDNNEELLKFLIEGIVFLTKKQSSGHPKNEILRQILLAVKESSKEED